MKIEPDEILHLLRKAVDEKGPHHVGMNLSDEGCQYFEDGQPSCIVGHVFSYLGVTEQHLGSQTNTVPVVGPATDGDWKMHSRLATSLQLAGLPEFDQKSIRLLTLAQNEQDHGTQWGDVVEMVEAYADQYLGSTL